MELSFNWFERGGLQFQVQFANKRFMAQQGLQKSDGAIDGATKEVKRKLVVLLRAILEDEGKRALEYIAAAKLDSPQTVERYLQQLRKGGLIEFNGDAAQTGGYYITEVHQVHVP